MIEDVCLESWKTKFTAEMENLEGIGWVEINLCVYTCVFLCDYACAFQICLDLSCTYVVRMTLHV